VPANVSEVDVSMVNGTCSHSGSKKTPGPGIRKEGGGCQRVAKTGGRLSTKGTEKECPPIGTGERRIEYKTLPVRQSAQHQGWGRGEQAQTAEPPAEKGNKGGVNLLPFAIYSKILNTKREKEKEGGCDRSLLTLSSWEKRRPKC